MAISYYRPNKVHLKEGNKICKLGLNMQICFIAFVNFKIYKSNKYVGWVGLAGGGGNIHWDNNMILPWKFY